MTGITGRRGGSRDGRNSGKQRHTICLALYRKSPNRFIKRLPTRTDGTSQFYNNLAKNEKLHTGNNHKLNAVACQEGIIVSLPASHAVGHGFVSRWVIPKTIIKMVQTASLLGMQALG